MEKTKYMLIRKSGKGAWMAIWQDNDAGRNVQSGKNSDKAKVEELRDRLKKMYPECKYAVLEVTED